MGLGFGFGFGVRASGSGSGSDQRVDVEEAEARARLPARGLLEGGEEPLLHLTRDAHARVGHRQADAPWLGFGVGLGLG